MSSLAPASPWSSETLLTAGQRCCKAAAARFTSAGCARPGTMAPFSVFCLFTSSPPAEPFSAGRLTSVIASELLLARKATESFEWAECSKAGGQDHELLYRSTL